MNFLLQHLSYMVLQFVVQLHPEFANLRNLEKIVNQNDSIVKSKYLYICFELTWHNIVYRKLVKFL